ncbi:MAG: hypothetical protein QG627_920 [Chlamydiota bacterium]|nr:hypothetical protein [Chlamydiota bacterium]
MIESFNQNKKEVIKTEVLSGKISDLKIEDVGTQESLKLLDEFETLDDEKRFDVLCETGFYARGTLIKPQEIKDLMSKRAQNESCDEYVDNFVRKYIKYPSFIAVQLAEFKYNLKNNYSDLSKTIEVFKLFDSITFKKWIEYSEDHYMGSQNHLGSRLSEIASQVEDGLGDMKSFGELMSIYQDNPNLVYDILRTLIGHYGIGEGEEVDRMYDGRDWVKYKKRQKIRFDLLIDLYRKDEIADELKESYQNMYKPIDSFRNMIVEKKENLSSINLEDLVKSDEKDYYYKVLKFYNFISNTRSYDEIYFGVKGLISDRLFDLMVTESDLDRYGAKELWDRLKKQAKGELIRVLEIPQEFKKEKEDELRSFIKTHLPSFYYEEKGMKLHEPIFDWEKGIVTLKTEHGSSSGALGFPLSEEADGTRKSFSTAWISGHVTYPGSAEITYPMSGILRKNLKFEGWDDN